MKVIILAGGYGTRLSEYTESIPKPMVLIDGKPIIYHIMQIFSHFGHKEFYIALGYKSEIIKNFFVNLKNMDSDIDIDYKSNTLKYKPKLGLDWKIHLVETGQGAFTGKRVKKIMSLIDDDNILLTYGDGLANVNLNKLINMNLKNKSIVTVTAVRPQARFGEIIFDKSGKVKRFKEKPQINSGWINGGFFVINKNFKKYLVGSNPILEREPLELAAKSKKFCAYKHHSFWQCVDNKRDLDYLRDISKKKTKPWLQF